MNQFCIIFAIFPLFKHFEYSVAEVYRAAALSVATSTVNLCYSSSWLINVKG